MIPSGEAGPHIVCGPGSGSRARRLVGGFTLVELLTVVGVVAILVCLTVPVISSGAMAANRARCASNLRQIGQAILLYAGDHDGVLPVTSHSTGDSRLKINGKWLSSIEYSWIYLLADYLDNVDEVRVCPADERSRQRQILQMNATSYLLNDTVFDSEVYGRFQNLPHPSRLMLAFISNRPVSRTWDHAHCANWTTWPALTTDVAVDRHRTGERIGSRLKGSANYLFADGHVQTMEAAEVKGMLDRGERPWLPGG